MPILVSSRLAFLLRFFPFDYLPYKQIASVFSTINYSWQPLSHRSISSLADPFFSAYLYCNSSSFRAACPGPLVPLTLHTFSYLLHSVPPIIPTPRGLLSPIASHSKLTPHPTQYLRPYLTPSHALEAAHPFGKGTSHRHKHVFTRPLIPSSFCRQCVLDLHALDKRAPYPHTSLATPSLLTSITVFLPSASQFWSGRPIIQAHKAYFSQPCTLTQAACPRL